MDRGGHMPMARRSVSRLGARAVAEAFGQSRVGDPAHDAECQRLLAQLRTQCPELVAAQPLPPGKVGAPLPVSGADLPALARAAIRAASGLPPAPPTGVPPVGGVTWVDGDRELYVAVEQVDVKLAPGVIAVTIPVRCDQAGARSTSASRSGCRTGRWAWSRRPRTGRAGPTPSSTSGVTRSSRWRGSACSTSHPASAPRAGQTPPGRR